MRSWMKMLAAASLAVVAMAQVGCGTTSLYVNIPEQAGDIARNDPNLEAVRQAEAVAVAESLRQDPVEGNVMLKLPQGSDQLSYIDVAHRTGGLVVTPYDGVEATVELEVTGVRLRGTSGAVDIVRPGRGGTPLLITVRLKSTPLDGWYAESLRRHGAPVSDQTVYYPLQQGEQEEN